MTQPSSEQEKEKSYTTRLEEAATDEVV